LSTLPAIIFDCDGVLIDSEGLASRVEAELLRELGLDLSVEETQRLFLGKTVDGVLDVITERTGKRPGSGFTDTGGRTLHAEVSARGHACQTLPGAVWPEH
jgi:beta-phosphoglucomutase-like phosphatase (HAD superfamily)